MKKRTLYLLIAITLVIVFCVPAATAVARGTALRRGYYFDAVTHRYITPTCSVFGVEDPIAVRRVQAYMESNAGSGHAIEMRARVVKP
jgi:hypothetical protein